MGAAAAAAVADELRERIAGQGQAAVLLASAPSQFDTWDALALQPGIEWGRVTVFHLDEYVGFDEAHPQSLRGLLKARFLSRIPIGGFHGLRGEAPGPEAECRRYARLLEENPPSLALIGIGENGHLAFNDPHVADFKDPLAVKIVDLDEACRRQQVHDGAFRSISEVPARALTLTIPRIMSAPAVFAAVPGSRKRRAVEAALGGPISPDCPASVLRTHPRCVLFLDTEAAPAGRAPR